MHAKTSSTVQRLGGEHDFLKFIQQNIKTDGGLERILNEILEKAGSDLSYARICRSEMLSTLLSLPERFSGSSYEYQEIFGQRWLETIAMSNNNLDDLLAELTERAIRRGYCQVLCDKLLSLSLGECDNLLWHSVWSKLSVDCAYIVMSTFILSHIRIFKSDIYSKDHIPIDIYRQDLGAVSMEDLDNYSLIYHRLFLLKINVKALDYCVKKFIIDHRLHSLILPVRLILVKAFSRIDSHLDSLFSNFLATWLNRNFSLFNSSIPMHRFISDILLMCCNLMKTFNNDRNAILKRISLESSITSMFSNAIGIYIECPINEIRLRQLLTAQVLANYFLSESQSGEHHLDFDLLDSIDKQWVEFISGNAMEFQWLADKCTKPQENAVKENHLLDDAADSDDESDIESWNSFGIDEETAQNISKVPAPRFLLECIDYLKSNEDDNDKAEKVEICLNTISNILSNPNSNTGNESIVKRLLAKLVHLHNQYDLPDFETKRRRAIADLIVKFPQWAGLELVDNLWNSSGLNFSQRLEIFGIMTDALNIISKGNIHKIDSTTNWKVNCYREFDRHLTDASTDNESSQSCELISESKTRITHPKSLEIWRNNNKRGTATDINNVWKVVQCWILPVIRGLWTSQMQWLRKEAKLFFDVRSVTERSQDHNNRESHKIQLNSIIFFARYLIFTSQMTSIAGPNDPDLVNNGKELGFVLKWFWNLMSSSQIECDDVKTNHDHEVGCTIAKVYESRKHNLLHHAEVRMAILYCLWISYVLDSRSSVKRFHSILPFGWDQIMDVESIIRWLSEIVLHDPNYRHRKIASHIMQMVKARFNT